MKAMKKLLLVLLTLIVFAGMTTTVFAESTEKSIYAKTSVAADETLTFDATVKTTLTQLTSGTYKYIDSSANVQTATNVISQAVTDGAAIAENTSFTGKGDKPTKITFDATKFPCAGVFLFEASQSLASEVTGFTVDNTKFTIAVAVKNTTTGGLEIANIAVMDASGEKKSASDTTDVSSTEMAYTHNYVSDKTVKPADTTDDPSDTDPDPEVVDKNDAKNTAPVYLDNTVTGIDAAFTYSVKITLPSGADMENYKTAYKNGDKVDAYKVAPESAADGVVQYSVSLKNGDFFYVDILPVGTKVDITQKTIEENYTYSYKLNGAAAVNKAGFTNQQLTASANVKAEYTNAQFETNITGIVMNNLPYVAVFAIALAVVFFMLVSRRRREEY